MDRIVKVKVSEKKIDQLRCMDEFISANQWADGFLEKGFVGGFRFSHQCSNGINNNIILFFKEILK